MAHFSKPSRNRRRFQPLLAVAGEGAAVLDRRLLLSGGMATVAGHGHAPVRPQPAAARTAHPAKVHHPAERLTPTQEINAQYAAFLAAFRLVEQAYVASIDEQSSGTVAVSTTVTAPYAAGSPVIQVADAAVFGPAGMFSTPLAATASVGGVTIGQFSLTGSSGNLLTLNTADSSFIPLNSGTVLSATVTVSAVSSAASIFPSYITNSTRDMAERLVQYFDNLPIKLPRKNTPPHQPQQTGAIQQFVYQLVAGADPTSLQQSLLVIILPATPGSDLQIYDAAVNSAVNASRLRTLNGVHQIFAGNFKIPGQAPTTTTGTTSSTTGSTSSTTK